MQLIVCFRVGPVRVKDIEHVERIALFFVHCRS